MKLFRPAVEDSDGGENDDLKAHHVEEGSTRTVLLWSCFDSKDCEWDEEYESE